MDHIKEAGREVEIETKEKIRDLDGHDLGDDVANAGDQLRKHAANIRDKVGRTVEEVDDDLDDDMDQTGGPFGDTHRPDAR